MHSSWSARTITSQVRQRNAGRTESVSVKSTRPQPCPSCRWYSYLYSTTETNLSLARGAVPPSGSSGASAAGLLGSGSKGISRLRARQRMGSRNPSSGNSGETGAVLGISMLETQLGMPPRVAYRPRPRICGSGNYRPLVTPPVRLRTRPCFPMRRRAAGFRVGFLAVSALHHSGNGPR
jgi:hypothetical protein